MSNKSFHGSGLSGPGSRTRRKISGDRQQGLTKGKCKEFILEMLLTHGQREMLKRLIQSRLAQSGWSYTMRSRCIDYIKRKGVDNVNVSHMAADIIPVGVDTFPESIRKEMEELLSSFTSEFITTDDSVVTPVDNETSACESFTYQNREAKPDPGIGYNVPTPEIALSRSPSPANIPRPLTPQPPPILRPENIKDEIKDEPLLNDDDMTSNVDEEDEPFDHHEEDDTLIAIHNHNIESEEEELMDV